MAPKSSAVGVFVYVQYLRFECVRYHDLVVFYLSTQDTTTVEVELNLLSRVHFLSLENVNT